MSPQLERAIATRWRSEEQQAEDRLATAIRLGPIVRDAAPNDANNECPERCAPVAAAVVDPPANKGSDPVNPPTGVRTLLREMRDPELTVRSNRRAYVLPRQIAIYIARQLTAASLDEIGREFGNRHHATVLHSINKIEAIRQTDEAPNQTITRLAVC